MKVGFISLAKTGHTSLNKMFPDIHHFSKFQKSWLEYGKQQFLKQIGDLKDYNFLFSCVRHPVDRFYSSYQECTKRYQYSKSIFDFFDDFEAGNLTNKQLWHTQAQSFHLIRKDLGFIVKLENIQNDVYDLCQILDRKMPIILHKNRSANAHKKDKKLESLLENHFSECMNSFNY